MNRVRIYPRGEPVIRAVLEATLDELARGGYGTLTFEDVAARAGVNKTTVYRRWATKPDLVKAALTAAADAMPSLRETGDLRTDLIAVARRARETMSSPRGRGLLRMLLGGCLEPELIALAFSLRKQVEAPARRLIERALLRGDSQRDADPDLVLDTISGWILHKLFREHASVTDGQLAALVDFVLQGVVAASPPARGRAGGSEAERGGELGGPVAGGARGRRPQPAARSRRASAASGLASSTARGRRCSASSAKSEMPSRPVAT